MCIRVNRHRGAEALPGPREVDERSFDLRERSGGKDDAGVLGHRSGAEHSESHREVRPVQRLALPCAEPPGSRPAIRAAATVIAGSAPGRRDRRSRYRGCRRTSPSSCRPTGRGKGVHDPGSVAGQDRHAGVQRYSFTALPTRSERCNAWIAVAHSTSVAERGMPDCIGGGNRSLSRGPPRRLPEPCSSSAFKSKTYAPLPIWS